MLYKQKKGAYGTGTNFQAVQEQKFSVYRRWKVDFKPMLMRNNKQVVQDDVRLKRIKDRAKGIKFGLTHHDISFRKRKEMEKILHNLELAAVAIDRELKSK